MRQQEGGEVATALRWIVGVLEIAAIPFQLAGGLAAWAYGATRPVVDIEEMTRARATGRGA